ncbi:uncharacterized protein LOC119871823 isoform X8 [Canis lupus familiaris]|uniref:uncharacterized protein LOC119871823 isoform X8 n=1 Tax=Canis lupus familiaris TaxID=9615 RepID=UPI0018F3468A|nr:uncharacterized protein LOC119871823 isoform X8 [Canis lupus familiaris]
MNVAMKGATTRQAGRSAEAAEGRRAGTMGCAKSRRMLVLRETVLVCRSVGAPGGNGVLERSGWWKAGGGREGRRRANWREAQVHETCSSRTCCDGGHVWCPVRRLLTMWLSSISNVASTNNQFIKNVDLSICDGDFNLNSRLNTDGEMETSVPSK